MMLALTLAAAAVAGLTLGLLGGGGSLLTLPILVYLAGVPARPAIAASLVVVAVTSTVAVLPHARAGRVRWRVGVPFAACGLVGAYGGGRLADLLPDAALLLGFGLMLAAAAIAMLRGRRPTTTSATPVRLGGPRTALLGVVLGLVTGLVGAGGGFVIVPVLATLGGLGMAEAVGTSLLVIAVQSAAGLAGHLHSVRLDWPLVLAVTAAAVAGSLVGGRLTGRIHPARLRRAFGLLVLAMAALVLAQQLPAVA